MMLSKIIFTITFLFFYQLYPSEQTIRLSHPQQMSLAHGTVNQLQKTFSSIEDINKTYVEGNWGDKFSPLELIILSTDSTDKLEKTKWLLENQMHFTEKSLRLLFQHKHESNNKILKYLLGHHSCPQLPNRLHLATLNQNLNAVQILLKNSANINALDVFGKTAIEWCSSHQDAVIFDLLLDHGAELPINKDSFLQNLASEKFGYVIIKSFFSRLMKGFINDKNVFGQTPLYAAVIRDLYKNVHAFMSYPMINTEIKDYDNQTALNYAKKYKSKKAGRVLAYYNHIKQLFRKPNWGHATEHLTIPMQLPSEIAAIIAYHATEEVVMQIEEKEKN